MIFFSVVFLAVAALYAALFLATGSGLAFAAALAFAWAPMVFSK